MNGEAYVVGAVRTPVGRRGGGLSGVHPADLGAIVVEELLARTNVRGEHVDDVIFGCVSQVGAQASNIARTVALSAGLPESVPGFTLDRQCGSSQQAVHLAAQAVASGAQDLVVAGGVEVMSLVPIASPTTLGQEAGLGHPRHGERYRARYGDQEITQFRGAELIAEHWDLSRERMELYALESHRRALAAQQVGAFDAELVAVGNVVKDEGPRADTTLERMASLAPLRPGGRLTAALASQISDGAAAILVASRAALSRYSLLPLARVHAMAVVGSDPVLMLTGPIPATEQVLKSAELSLDDIDVVEVNEAFASVVLAWQQATGADPARTNPWGGAIALGHPLGATGARLMTTMLHDLQRRNLRYGLQVMCEGGGMANATVLERL
ncbi:MAG: acetyl-CoA C-acetyltransferase [Candidatus Nanopelagicales bacterium]